MIGIVIVAHGGLAREYLAAVEHVIGKQSGVRAVSIEYDHDRADKKAEIQAAVESVETGDGVILVTDMFGGSPSNLSMMACTDQDRRIIYGANLPLLIKLAKSRNLPISRAVSEALSAGKKYINTVQGGGDGGAV